MTGMLFISVIAVFFILMDRSDNAEERLKDFGPSGLERLSAGKTDDGQPTVIVIGTSLTHCALYFDEEMEKFAVQNGFGGPRFITFTRDGASLDDFIPLLDLIRKAKPEYLFLESNLFGIEFSFQKDYTVNRLHHYLRRMLITKEKWGCRQQHQTTAEFAMYRHFTRNAGLRTFSLPREYEIAFEDLRRGGTQIVLLDMPRSAKAVSAYPAGFFVDMRRLFSRYQHTYGLRLWDSPYYPDTDRYADFAHLNEKGRNAYSLWFLRKFSRSSAGNGQ